MNSESSEPPIIDPATAAVSALHPLSLLFELSHRVRTNLIPAIFASFSAATGGIVGLYIGLGIFGVAIALAIVRFMTFRYRLTDDHLLVDQGLIFRTHRSVPIDRIQNIDSVQNLFHRFFKVAEVRIETASGNEPEAIMRVISVEEVERLRSQLTRLSTSRSTDAPADASFSATQSDGSQQLNGSTASSSAASAAPIALTTSSSSSTVAQAETILTIPVSRLIKAGLISNRGQVLAGLVVGYFIQSYTGGVRFERLTGGTDRTWLRGFIRSVVSQVGQSFDWLGATGNQLIIGALVACAVIFVILLLRVFSAAWFVMKFYDYQLVRRGRDFQIQCGLFTRVSASVPGDRIQVVCVHRTWLARQFGLAAIRVEASGGSGKEEEDASATVARQWFVPVMSAKELPRVLQALQPGIYLDDASIDWKSPAPRVFARLIRLPLAVFALVFLVSLALSWYLDWSYAAVPFMVSVLGSSFTVLWARKRAKSRKFARTENGYIYRSGTLTQKTSYGFWDRTQSVSLTQSPFDRRWGMAALLFDTAGAGTADHPLTIEYLTSDTARAEYDQASERITRAHQPNVI